MLDKYKIQYIDKANFVTLNVVGWIDVFAHKNHKIHLTIACKTGFSSVWMVFNVK
jgi:hypothetical protein